jgi:hypothetical protein
LPGRTRHSVLDALLPCAFPSPGVSAAIAVTVKHGDRGQIVPTTADSLRPLKPNRIPGAVMLSRL